MKLEHTLGIVSFFLITGGTTQLRFASARTIDIENEQIRLRASNSKSTSVDSGAPLPATTTRTEIRQLQARETNSCLELHQPSTECAIIGESLSCPVGSSITYEGVRKHVIADLICPLDSVSQTTFLEAAEEGLCECSVQLADRQCNLIDVGMDCQCRICPPGSLLEHTYTCTTEISEGCSSFDCSAACIDGAEVATDTDGGGEEISADESTFDSPTFAPTTAFPTGEAETGVPTELTGDPTRVPTRPPITEAPVTEVPTESPTDIPTRRVPTESPKTEVPTKSPTDIPTRRVSTEAPETEVPTESPTDIPTRRVPTEAPETEIPTESPTDIPTRRAPSESPDTGSPTVKPSASAVPTQEPSAAPSPKPTPCPVTLGIGNIRCIGSGITRDHTVSRGSSILAF